MYNEAQREFLGQQVQKLGHMQKLGQWDLWQMSNKFLLVHQGNRCRHWDTGLKASIKPQKVFWYPPPPPSSKRPSGG